MSAFERLQRTLAQTLRVAPAIVSATSRDQELPQWDSLGHINLIMALEQEFGVYVEVEDFGNLNSGPAILAHLHRQGVQ